MNNKFKKIITIVILLFIFFILINTLNVSRINLILDDFFSNRFNMNSNVVFMLILLVALIAVFIWEPISISLIAILVPVVLTLFDRFTNITVSEALSGFSNPATVTVMAMFVFSAGVQRSGAVQLLGDRISSITGSNERKQIALISVLTGSSAGFINNTPVVAALIPMVRQLARRTKVSPSKLLMPLSFAAMLGGTITLIGTSTNLLASEVVERYLGEPFGMFQFTGLGLIVLFVGILYLLTIGYKLTPTRIDIERDLTSEYEMRDYLTKVAIAEGCDFVGKNVKDIIDHKRLDYDIVRIIRDGEQFMEPLNSKTIRSGDQLIIRANHETLAKLVKRKGIRTLPELIVDDKSIEQPVKGELMVEVVIPSHSYLVNKTLEDMNFLERYDCNVLAVRRGQELTHQEISEYTFHPGDLILMLVTEPTLERMRKDNNFIIDREYDPNFYDNDKMYISAGILLFFVLSIALNLISVAMAALTGAFLMVISGVINKDELFKSIDWEVYFLLAGLIPLGIAIEKTNTASFIANKILTLSDIFSPLIILMIFYALTALLTNMISNNASVLLMLPIAINAANQLSVNPFAFALAITFAASAAFASPIGYQTNLMVYSSGGYKFKDFIVAGTPLQLIMTLVVPICIKLIWGF